MTFETKKPLLGLRWVVALLSLGSFFLMFFLRNSFSVVLVDMVNSTGSTNDHDIDTDDVCPLALNKTFDEGTNSESSGDYAWSTSQQSLILSAYVWGFVITRLLGSRVSEIVGQRETVAVLTFIAGALTLVSPFAASIHPLALAAMRFLIGCCHGPLFAAQQTLLAAWAPPKEQSSMSTTMYSGITLGSMTGFLVAGWLTEEYGWTIMFWAGGTITILFLPFWVIFVRNSPSKHPWLTPYERDILAVNKHITIKKKVPWRKMLLSPYINILIIAQFSRNWTSTVIAVYGPFFLRNKIGLDLNLASYICGASSFCALISMLVYGRLSDFIIVKQYVSRIHARKLFHFISSGVGAVLLAGLTLADCNAEVVVALWLSIGLVLPASSCSTNLSSIDIAPNFAGTIMGILGIGNISGGLAPLVQGILLNQTNGWNKSFLLSAGLSSISCITYLFMTDKPQAWNFEGENQNSQKDSDEAEKNEQTRF